MPHRNPYVGSEEGEVEEEESLMDATKGPEQQKGKKNKNKDKGQKKKVQKNKPVLVDVDLSLSAYANAKKWVPSELHLSHLDLWHWAAGWPSG